MRALGEVAIRRNQLEDASRLCAKALAIYQQIGVRRGEASTLLAIGLIGQMRVDIEPVVEAYLSALLIFKQIGDQHGEARSLYLIGTLAMERGKPAEAFEPLSRAAELFDMLGMEEQARAARERLSSRVDAHAALPGRDHLLSAPLLDRQS